MPLRECLALEIRAAAEDQEITIVELAQRAGTHRVTLHRYLDATRSMPIETLERIASALRLRGSELLARAEQRRARGGPLTLTEALGAEIRAEAAAQRITIAELAKRADVNRSSLYTWIDAKTAFPIQGLEAVANVLRVRASELVARAEHRSRTHRSVTPAGQ